MIINQALSVRKLALIVLFSLLSLVRLQAQLTDQEILDKTNPHTIEGCVERISYYSTIMVKDSSDHYIKRALNLNSSFENLDALSIFLDYYESERIDYDSLDYILNLLSSERFKTTEQTRQKALMTRLKYYNQVQNEDSVSQILAREWELAEVNADTEYKLSLWTQKISILLRRNQTEKSAYEIDAMLKFVRKLPPSKNTVVALQNLSKRYAYNLNGYSNAVFCLFLAEQHATEINDTFGLRSTYYIQSNMFDLIGDIDRALTYQRKVHSLQGKNLFAHEKGNIYSSFAWSFIHLNQLDSAEYYLNKSISIYQNGAPLDIRIGFPLSNLGIVCYKQKKYEEAISLFEEAKKRWLLYKLKTGLNECSAYTGLSLIGLNNYSEAKRLLKENLNQCHSVNDLGDAKITLEGLIQVYQHLNIPDSTVYYQEQYIDILNQINDRKNLKKINDVETAFIKETYNETLESLAYSESLKNEIIKRQKLFILITLVFLVFMSILFVKVFLLNKRVTKNKKEIEHQNKVINAQKNEIIESILCAERIQNSLMNSGKSGINSNLNAFQIYLPRDIVGGDFVWSKHFENSSYLLLGDCTGHGVSGAMLSMMSIALIEEVIENGDLNPSKIAQLLKERIINLLNLNSSDINKEGFDIAIIRIEKDSNRIQYTGANIPLYHISKGELKQYNPTKTSISYSYEDIDFECLELSINKGDRIYLMSDGVRDQFGGPNDKKLNSKRLKEILSESSNLHLHSQEIALRETIIKWKGDNAQTDDICLLGIEF